MGRQRIAVRNADGAVTAFDQPALLQIAKRGVGGCAGHAQKVRQFLLRWPNTTVFVATEGPQLLRSFRYEFTADNPSSAGDAEPQRADECTT